MPHDTDKAAPDAPTRTHHRVLVIGGGNAGLSVAGRLRRMGVDHIAVIEPRDKHVFAPMQSHIAGGTARASLAVKSQRSVTPRGVEWIRATVESVQPDDHTVTLTSGTHLTYDQLIVCPGIQQDWDAIDGLSAAMDSPAGVSNYTFELAKKASRVLRHIRSGTVVFSQPPGPASCSAAAQKPMYLACDYWRATGVLADMRVVLVVPDDTVFGIPLIDRELMRKIGEYGIELRTQSEITSVDAEGTFVRILNHADGRIDHVLYDVLHVEPPQSAAGWIEASGLSTREADGFVDIDPRTLQSRHHPTVWALGDAAATTNSKSGGALRMQTQTVAKNLTAALRGEAPTAIYDGYSVSPITVSRGTVVFAEFDDQYRLKPTIPFWRGMARESRLMWLLDRHVLPWVYWHMILKGRA